MRKIKIILLSIILISTALIVSHNIDKKITQADIEAISFIIPPHNFIQKEIHASYQNQIDFILTIQSEVLDFVEPSSTGIALGNEREPKDLVEEQYGQCFDRTRLIEKVLIYYGFKTRHLSIYSNENMSFLKTLLSPQSPSHATTEVKTSKGWLIVDSNTKWISLNENTDPLSFKNLNINELIYPIDSTLTSIYSTNSYGIYGLYSRHGMFYPPFNKIPDFNFRELFYNCCI